MHFTAASAVAMLAFASTAVAESPMYKMSTRQLFGIVRRQDDGAYVPDQAACNNGATCAEACGAGFEQCKAVSEADVHCYNKGAGHICCPSNTGNSCEPGYYCAANATNAVSCCKNGQSLTDCAAQQEGAGVLTSLTAAATTSTTTTTSSTTTTTPSTTTTTTPTIAETTVYVNSTSTTCTETIKGSASYAGSNSTSTKPPVVPPTKPAAPSNTTGGPVPAGASGLAASAMAAIVGVAFAALML